MSSRLCFCTLCKGAVLQSSYKVKQHTSLYGLWYSKKSMEGPPAAKKSKTDESDASCSSYSSSSDEEDFNLTDDVRSCTLEEHTDGPDDCVSDVLFSASNQDESKLAKVRACGW